MSFHNRNITLLGILSDYQQGGISEVIHSIITPDAISIDNPHCPAGDKCTKLIQLIQAGDSTAAEKKIKKYSIELNILNNRMQALLRARNEKSDNPYLQELINKTDVDLRMYMQK